jgi:hypothetical protein
VTGEHGHLAPPLRTLSGDALRLWGDAAERQRALETVVHAWETGSPDLQAAVERVDRAVVEGLAAVGLPRGPVREVRIESSRANLAGQKLPDSSLILFGERLRDFVRERGQGDTTFRTWVHESLHARQPYAVRAASEYRQYRGYEEGMVEGLARLVTRVQAGMNPLEVSYGYYVTAYHALASILTVPVEPLWRELWQRPTGEVRAGFVPAVDAAHLAGTGRPLTSVERARLLGVADTLFRSDRSGDLPDESVMGIVWRAVFR